MGLRTLARPAALPPGGEVGKGSAPAGGAALAFGGCSSVGPAALSLLCKATLQGRLPCPISARAQTVNSFQQMAKHKLYLRI